MPDRSAEELYDKRLLHILHRTQRVMFGLKFI